MDKHRLGDVAYIDHNDGTVTRTIVSRVGVDNQARYLEHSYRPPHATFELAQAAALATLRKKEQELGDELERLRTRIETVGAAAYRAHVNTAPLKSISGSTAGAAFNLDREIEGGIPVPKSYFEPGQEVFCVIVPKTHNIVFPHYRPHDYFVLGSRVKEAQLVSDGNVAYLIDSYYHPRSDAIFATLDEAKQALLKAFAAATGGTLPLEKAPFVSFEEEAEQNRLSTERISQQIRRQFDKLPAGD